jgi:acyl carrier protein
MSDTTANAQTCQFKDSSGASCGSSVHSDYKFCLEHLAVLTRIFVRERCVTLLANYATVAPEELDEPVHFVNDLNFNSLDGVEFIMELEEAFDLSIPDEDAQQIATLRDAHTYLTHRHLEQGEFVLDGHLDSAGVLRRLREREDARTRHVNALVDSALFTDYVERLSLSPTRLADSICTLLADDWIEHVTTAPSWVENRLSSVSIILLTKTSLLHFGLKAQEILNSRS